MAEALLHDRLSRIGFDAKVSSAGRLYDDTPVSSGSVLAMADRGFDIRRHRSRRMTSELLRDADLVLGMAREHVREAVVLEPDVFPRAFTLKELVRRGEAIGPRRRGEPLDVWLTRAHEGRDRRHLLGTSPDDDVGDPIGGSADLYARTAVEIERLVDRLVELAFAHARPQVASEGAI